MEKIKDNIKAQILAMSDMGWSNVKIAKAEDITETSVRRIKSEYKKELIEKVGDVGLLAKTGSIVEIKQHFAEQCHKNLDLFSKHMTVDKAKKASIRDLAISYGIMFDKMSLAKNLATENIDVKHSLVQKVRGLHEAE